MPFGYTLNLAGGWDATDQGDQLYFNSKRVEGLGSGLSALVVPSDWKQRATHPVGPGFAALDEPIILNWITGKENLPEAKPAKSGAVMPDRWKSDLKLIALQRLPLDQTGRVFESPTLGDYHGIHEALLGDQDAYVVVPTKGHLKHGFDLYGASGPPIVWVHLGHVDVSSGESPLAYGVARSVGAVAWGLDLTVAAALYLLAVGPMGPFGGALVLTDPISTFIPETPW